MLNLKELLFLLLETLQDDKKSLYSCLLVNKTWCEIVILILWKNPWKYLEEKKRKLLFKVIASHLSNETKENLKSQGTNLSSIIRQKPLFNYINYCRYLNLYCLERIVSIKNIEESKISNVKNEIFKLFINRNTRFTHLYIPQQCNYQTQLIPTGVERCFSELKFLQFNSNINQNLLEGLIKTSKSIKRLEIYITSLNNNYEIITKLIGVQKSLNEVLFIGDVTDEPFCKSLEESLIQHVETVQYLRIDWKPITKILSYLENLVSLEIFSSHHTDWSYLENVSLPSLTILKTQRVPSKYLAGLIENTERHLTEISIDREGDDNNKKLIQAIYKNCPNILYLKLLFNNSNILELKNLLINCQNLNGLVITLGNELDWDSLFKILAESSPVCLFKFKFYCTRTLELESLKLFFDSWKDKHPMLLQTMPVYDCMFDLINKYKAEGIVKKYDDNLYSFEDFEWIKKTTFFTSKGN
ncbi:hypothetical protein C1645_820084 [Glomus cerebriforme]|uniref:F-box domain-containing protein n=1 Tax=Glomus cerebriforme TaxID=658196 RepID=A0A397TD58_9GLOM|nr:hypothetical protein C1645_820084 [Glomus cerebriforme]